MVELLRNIKLTKQKYILLTRNSSASDLFYPFTTGAPPRGSCEVPTLKGYNSGMEPI